MLAGSQGGSVIRKFVARRKGHGFLDLVHDQLINSPSIANSSSIRRTALAAIGASPVFARLKNFRLPWLQHAASRIGAVKASVARPAPPSVPVGAHARCNPVAARNLRHLRPWRQRLLGDRGLLIQLGP